MNDNDLNGLLLEPVAQRVYVGVHVCSVCEVDWIRVQNCLAFSLVRTAALRTEPDFSLDVPSSPTHGDTLTRFSTLCEALAGCRSCVWSVRQCPCYEVLRARDAYLRIYMRGRSQLCWGRHVTPHKHHNCQQNSRGTVSLTNAGKLILTRCNGSNTLVISHI